MAENRKRRWRAGFRRSLGSGRNPFTLKTDTHSADNDDEPEAR